MQFYNRQPTIHEGNNQHQWYIVKRLPYDPGNSLTPLLYVTLIYVQFFAQYPYTANIMLTCIFTHTTCTHMHIRSMHPHRSINIPFIVEYTVVDKCNTVLWAEKDTAYKENIITNEKNDISGISTGKVFPGILQMTILQLTILSYQLLNIFKLEV